MEAFGTMMQIPDFDDQVWLQGREPTLRLLRGKVTVLSISRIQSTFCERRVRRHLSNKTDKAPF